MSDRAEICAFCEQGCPVSQMISPSESGGILICAKCAQEEVEQHAR